MIVVGAGPVGLMLAAELGLAGVRALVLDRLDEPTGQSRGLGFTARAMEVFDQRGLLPRFGAPVGVPAGHFGGLPMDFSVLRDAHFGARGVPQAVTERILADRAAELGVIVRRGADVVGLAADEDGVEVFFEDATGTHRVAASYVVGCDGGRSTIRELAGFDFPGTPATCEMFLADVSGCDVTARFIGERVPGGMVMAAPLDGDVHRIIVCERGTPPRRRSGPPAFAEVAAAWQRLTGQDISRAQARWVSAFTDATRQVTQYRRGRVLLAGDAAHVHLPAGGQGLSLGVQDAVNLGWKLAAEVDGWAPAGLLDSYHDERHPVGAKVLRNTRAQGLLYLSGAEVDPLRAVMADLIELPEVGRHLAGMVSGLDIRYDCGPGDHPLLGRRLPPDELVARHGAVHTAELLHAGRAVLLDLADDPALAAAVAGWADRFDVVTAKASAQDRFADTAALLVRPDGHVVWASPAGGDLDSALRRWFGAPRE